jgi:ABC-type transport system involved in cytochrome c biogenesis permease component
MVGEKRRVVVVMPVVVPVVMPVVVSGVGAMSGVGIGQRIGSCHVSVSRGPWTEGLGKRP